MSKHEIEMESKGDVARAIAVLEKLLAEMRTGTITFEDEEEGDVVMLSPAGEVEIEFRAKQKRDKESLTIKLSWEVSPLDEDEDEGEDEEVDEEQELRISSDRPSVD
ncbi:MAG: hypothetical protein CHACPFDD_01099 [Phycisphaerae bacterium]|nr:hypothetical protein [Phycisphaerae bacterium]